MSDTSAHRFSRFSRSVDSEAVVAAVRASALPVQGAESDFDPLLDLIGDARYVLIGEASHGTHEFYSTRAMLTRRLIQERGFTAVAAEADWPDAYRINRYVRGIPGDGTSSIDALSGFQRFPTWMWRNADVLNFVGWLRQHNDDVARAGGVKAGFYGLDLYSMYQSMAAVVGYLEGIDPRAAEQARARYACFEQFGVDPQSYGLMTGYAQAETCEDQAVQQLVSLRERAAEYARKDLLSEDEYFFAEQNAVVAVRSEEYYRAMYRGRVNTWNLRDTHMVNTLDALVAHLDRQVDRQAGQRGQRAKVVVWAHNSHLGDARATEVGRRGEVNVGQLVRERHDDEARLIGFTTDHGTVTAADDWDHPAQRKRVRPGYRGSYEEAFAKVGMPAFILPLRDHAPEALREPRLERAIGVIYRPETERQSHYFFSDIASQFDAVIHFDETRAVEPLEVTATWEAGEAPETYPSAL